VRSGTFALLSQYGKRIFAFQLLHYHVPLLMVQAKSIDPNAPCFRNLIVFSRVQDCSRGGWNRSQCRET
jgi:hypothetical protein